MTVKQTKSKDVGYQSVHISKRAYRKILEMSVAERRTVVATVDILLGV